MKFGNLIVSLFLIVSIDCQAQSIKKVTGVKNISFGYSNLKYGNSAIIKFSDFLSKGYYYFLQGSWEGSKVSLTTYNSYMGGIGIGKCIILPIKKFYLNLDLGANFGNLQITNEYYSEKNEFISNMCLTPGFEYFIGKRCSIIIGTSFFKDFHTDFRNYHYSYNASLNLTL
jgi:hypothetical protein